MMYIFTLDDSHFIHDNTIRVNYRPNNKSIK